MFKWLFALMVCLSLLKVVHAEEVPMASVEDLLKEPNEIEVIDNLISITESQLAAQQRVKELMMEFQKQRDCFTLENPSKKQAYLMVKTARDLLSLITEYHLHQMFSPEYIEELSLFSSIAGKNTPTRP